MSDTYRQYPDDSSSSVYQHYYHKNINQTVQLVQSKIDQYIKRPKRSMRLQDVLATMNDYKDPSDPDTDGDNLTHAYQTAERIRKDHPNDEWFQLVGLIHDAGKMLYTRGEPDWCVVGDTFPVGCQFSEHCLYSQFFRKNPDYGKYDTIGIYSPECGLDKLNMTWGHDEYLYRVLIDNKDLHTFPPLGARIIRYHSFYPLHRHGAYSEFLNDDDMELLPWLQKFSSYDLYSKHDHFVLTPEIKTYYDDLLNKYFPVPLLW